MGPNDHGNSQSEHVFLQAHQVLEKKISLCFELSVLLLNMMCFTQLGGITVYGLLVLSQESLQCQTDFVGPYNMTQEE